MTQGKHALILTGELLPGFSAEQAWPALAAQFRIDLQRLRDDVLARAPIALKESADRARLERMQAEAAAVGAAIEIHALDDDDSVFVLIDNTPRGPLPRRFVAARIAAGTWPANLRIAAVGSSQWTEFTPGPAAGVPAPPPLVGAPALPPAGEPDRGDADGAQLPPGGAIHAGYWRRSAAYLIDGLIVSMPLLIVNVVPLLGILAGLVGYWLYFALTESSSAQATLGKRAMGIKVTDLQGRRITFGHATGRFFAAALSVMTMYIGYFLAGWTERRQALHDLVAGTCVVFREVEPGQALPAVRMPMPWYGWLVNIVLLSVLPLSILAAVSIPAYQDYVARSKVVAVSAALSPLKIELAEARMTEGADCPRGARSLDDPLVESVVFAGEPPRCLIVVTFASAGTVPSPLRGRTLEWTYEEQDRDGNGAWRCSSTLARKHLPTACR